MATNVALTDLKDYFQSDAVDTHPDFTVLKSLGFPTDGNPTTGLPATLPGSAWFALLAAMRLSVIKAAGLTPSNPPDPLQFLAALQSLEWMNDKSIQQKHLADLIISNAKVANSTLEFAKLSSTAIATTEEAKAGTATDKLMTPKSVKDAVTEFAAPLPVGTIIPLIAKSVPSGYLQCDGSQLDHGDAPVLCEILWQFDAFKGDSTSYAVLPDLDGRVVQGVTSIAQVGTYLEAQLPNITGQTISNITIQHGDECSGCLSLTDLVDAKLASGAYNYHAKLHVNATVANSLYSGDSFQLPALQSLVCIKV